MVRRGLKDAHNHAPWFAPRKPSKRRARCPPVRVVGFTGLPGSGKSFAAEVARVLGVPVVRMGDCVWDEVRARSLPLTDEHVGRVAHEMRERHGPAVWAQRTLEKVRKLGAEQVAIDGIRSMAEVECFRAALGADFILVAIHASPATRHARLLTRAREDEAASEAAARERDRREMAWGLGEVMALADVLIVNEGVHEVAFRGEVERLLTARWRAGPRSPASARGDEGR
jgi:dephospho-CoA kinase